MKYHPLTEKVCECRSFLKGELDFIIRQWLEEKAHLISGKYKYSMDIPFMQLLEESLELTKEKTLEEKFREVATVVGGKGDAGIGGTSGIMCKSSADYFVQIAEEHFKENS